MGSQSQSSRKWLERQKKDVYVQKAKQAGYRSRAAFKLIEIQEKHRVINPGMRVLELGSAPGSWTELMVQWVKSKGAVFAVDLLDMAPINGVEFCQCDIETEEFLNWCNQHKADGFDMIVSDMAPNMSGHQMTDQLRSARLVEWVLETADSNLKAGGSVLVKVFHGSEFNQILKELRLAFKQVKVIKPEASRRASGEVYLLAVGKKASGDSRGTRRVDE